jgi:hypothetical protein
MAAAADQAIRIAWRRSRKVATALAIIAAIRITPSSDQPR